MKSGLTKQQLEIIAEAVMKEQKKQEKRLEKEKRDNRLFNTKLIVCNYRQLKAHCNTIPEKIEEFEESMFDEEKLSLETLMRERAKTYSMMKYIDSMWRAYEDYSFKMDDLYKRRFEILDRLYISDNVLSVSKLSEKYHVSVPAIYKDRNIAIKDFSVILFGINMIGFKG